MSSIVFWINDTSDVELGIALSDLQRWAAGTSTRFQSQPAPGRAGHVIGAQPTMPPRVVPLEALIAADTLEERDTKLGRLLARLSGLLELRFADSPDRVLRGVCTASESAGQSVHSFAVADLRVPVEVTCFDPLKHDHEPRSVAFASVRTPVPTGSMPHGGRLYIMGPATDPEVIVRSAAGVEIQRMGFEGDPLASDEYYLIDLDVETVSRVTDAAAADAIDDWTIGSEFLRFDPGDGDIETESYPTIEVTAGSGLLLYRRAWRH